MDAPAPKIGGVLETALYVDDLARSAQFYEQVLGLATIFRDERLCAMDCGPRSVLLLFARDMMSEAVKLPGGDIPPHEGSGRIHFAFAVAAEDLSAWEERLSTRGVAVESRVNWPGGAESVYFRDPDGNLAEFATPGLWSNY